MNRKLIIGALLTVGIIAGIWLWPETGSGSGNLPQVLTDIRSRAQDAPLAAGGSFFLIYVLTAALGIPGAVLLTSVVSTLLTRFGVSET